jgi:YNFM family putative membrane transporter
VVRETAVDPARLRRAIVGMTSAGVVAFAALYGIQALLPAVARSFQVDAAAASLAQSIGAIGLAVAVIPWTLVAARVGRGRALRAAVIASVIGSIVVPLMPTIELLIAARFVHGVVIAGIPTLALAHLTEILGTRGALLASGWYIAGTSLGGLFGRIVAGIAGQSDWRVGMFTVAGVVTAAGVLLLTVTPPPREFVATRTGGARAVVRTPALWNLAVVAFLLMGAFAALYNVLGFRLVGPDFRLPDVAVALVFLAYLFGTASSALVGRLAARWGRRLTLLVMVGLQLIGVVLTASGSLPIVLVGLAIATAGFFAAHALAAGWSAALGGPGGSAMYTLGYYAGAGLFGWLAGHAYVAGGWAATVVMLAALTAAAGVAVLLLPRTGPPTATGSVVAAAEPGLADRP